MVITSYLSIFDKFFGGGASFLNLSFLLFSLHPSTQMAASCVTSLHVLCFNTNPGPIGQESWVFHLLLYVKKIHIFSTYRSHKEARLKRATNLQIRQSSYIVTHVLLNEELQRGFCRDDWYRLVSHFNILHIKVLQSQRDLMFVAKQSGINTGSPHSRIVLIEIWLTITQVFMMAQHCLTFL